MFIVRTQIENKLNATFEPVHLDVIDESYRHHVAAGAQSHFKIIIVTDRFQGERFLARHRMIYNVLLDEMQRGVHALALHTYTVKEWNELHDMVPPSPPCYGAGHTD